MDAARQDIYMGISYVMPPILYDAHIQWYNHGGCIALFFYICRGFMLFYLHRSRSIYERGLDVDHRNITLWLKYAEMEMKNRQVNHARNIWDRAITILPRVNQFW